MTIPLVKSVPASSAERERTPSGGGLRALFRKELADQLNSNRFLLLFALLAIAGIAGFYGALSTIRDSSEEIDFLYLTLFTTSGNNLPSFASFLAFLSPLMGIVLGFDAVSRERSQGTLNRLAAQPIHRDAILTGKFLSGVTVIFLTIFAMGFLVLGAGILSLGVPPQGEEVARIVTFLIFCGVYVSFWLAFSMLLSAWCRHAATSALGGIAIWIFLSFFYTMIASATASAAYPLDGIEGFYNQEANYNLTLALDRISPYYLFSEAASTILNPNVRSIGVITMSQLSGAVASYLPFDQSLLLVWPHIVCMVAVTAICFAVAYIGFMRQEIRA